MLTLPCDHCGEPIEIEDNFVSGAIGGEMVWVHKRCETAFIDNLEKQEVDAWMYDRGKAWARGEIYRHRGGV